jgi:hypothetical protein
MFDSLIDVENQILNADLGDRTHLQFRSMPQFKLGNLTNKKAGMLPADRLLSRCKSGIAELKYDSPSHRLRLRLWLPSPKLESGAFRSGFPTMETHQERGAGGEGEIHDSYLNSAMP